MSRRRRADAIKTAAAASQCDVAHRCAEYGCSAFLDATLPHLDTVANLARNLTRSRFDAEDLVQDTYLRAFENFGSYRGGSMRAWLATICLNLARSDGRRRARRPVELLTENVDAGMPASEPSVVDVVTARLSRAALRAALDDLPEPQRLCILLMDVAGYTASEAAAVLDCPRGTVLARVHRGRRRLAQLLAELGVDHV